MDKGEIWLRAIRHPSLFKLKMTSLWPIRLGLKTTSPPRERLDERRTAFQLRLAAGWCASFYKAGWLATDEANENNGTARMGVLFSSATSLNFRGKRHTHRRRRTSAHPPCQWSRVCSVGWLFFNPTSSVSRWGWKSLGQIRQPLSFR